ncbi:MAG: GMP/IMP nucleotidase [Desulforhopalus sp.]
MYNVQPERVLPFTNNFIWEEIDTIFLDMDGTLLDKYYDDYFWEHFVPEVYAAKNNVEPAAARTLLLDTYRRVENTLQWTDLDYWSKQLDLDIAALKYEIRHLVSILPHVTAFFEHLKEKKKKTHLITNAHPTALKIKMDQVNLAENFQRMICSKEVGAAKEQPEFWEKLQDIIPYDKRHTLFADDTEKVLHSAKEYGIRHLVHIAKPSSRLPARFSIHYPSISNFQELIT